MRFSTPENAEILHQTFNSCRIDSNKIYSESLQRAEDNRFRIGVIGCVVVEIFQKVSFLGWRLFQRFLLNVFLRTFLVPGKMAWRLFALMEKLGLAKSARNRCAY